MKKYTHQATIKQVALEKDYQKAWVCSQNTLLLQSNDNSADLYHIDNQTVSFTLNNFNTPISSVLSFSPKLLLTGTTQGAVQLWNLPETSNSKPLIGENLQVSSTEINTLTVRNAQQFIATDMSYQLTIWDAKTREKVFQHQFDKYVYAVRVIDNDNLELLTTDFMQFNKIQFSLESKQLKHIANLQPNRALSGTPIQHATLSPSGDTTIFRTDKTAKGMNSIWMNHFSNAAGEKGKKSQVKPYPVNQEDDLDIAAESVATISNSANRACFFFPKQNVARLVQLPETGKQNTY